MKSLEQTYLALPVTLQNVACSLEGWRVQRERYGGPFHRILSGVEDRLRWSDTQVREFRDARLREFLLHCERTVPYYSDTWRRLGLRAADVRGLEDLQYFPILTKREVQDNYPHLLSRALPEREHIIAHTSGTTGGGLRFACTRDAIQEQWAIWWRYRRQHGIELNTWCAYFGGRSVVPLQQQVPPFWRWNYPGRQLIFSGYHMSPENLGFYVDKLQRSKIEWIHGYPSLLSLIGNHIIERNIDFGHRVRWITTGAENLMPHQVAILSRAFGVRPCQHYGMAEAVGNASECEMGSLHVDEDFAAVEFVGQSDPRRLVGTNFTNRATPLVRYDTQDLATVAFDRCSCGREGRTITKIDGRQEDFIVLRNGSRVGRLDHIFKDLVRIREAQIVQNSPGEVLIRIVRGPEFGDRDEMSLRREVAQRLGSDTEVRIEYCAVLERTKTGKLRFVISRYPSDS
jgi:phenylacetate-CoA ligase